MMFVAPIGRRSFFLLNVLVVLTRVKTMHADVFDSLKVRFHLLLNVKGGKVVSEGDEKKKSRDQIDGPSRSRGVDARGRAPFCSFAGGSPPPSSNTSEPAREEAVKTKGRRVRQFARVGWNV